MAKGKKSKAEPAVPQTPAPGTFVALATMTDDNYTGPKLLCSLDISTRAGKRMFINSQSPPSFTPDKLRGKVFRLANWIGEPRVFHDDQTKEDRLAVSITLLDPDGRTARFGSEAITRAMDVIRAMYGDGPYEPALYVRIDPYETKNSKRSYTLQEVDPETVKKEEQTW